MKSYVVLVALLFSTISGYARTRVDTLVYKPFGEVFVMNPVVNPAGVALVISDRNGWTEEMETLAKRLANEQLMVVGINLHHLLEVLSEGKSQCIYPASNFENLSIYLQKRFKLKTYHKPILVGKGAGATLAYALIAQAPANTFRGGVALGFSSTIEFNKRFCKGSGLVSTQNAKHNRVSVLASAKLLAPLMVIPEGKDMKVNLQECQKFFKGMERAEVIVPDKDAIVKEGEPGWGVTLAEAIQRIQSTKPFGGSVQHPEQNVAATEIANLPFVETDAVKGSNPVMALLISGDGGWTDFDQSLANELAGRGIPSVGLDTQKYFWEKKSPEKTAADVEKLLLYYSKKFGREKILLMGYSFGADVIPFIANRLSPNLKERLVMVAMLSPDDNTDFEVTISSMLNLDMESEYEVAPEVKKMTFVPKLCIYGADEDEAQDQELFRKQGAQIVVLAGGHHYGDSYKEIISTVLAPIQNR